MADDCIFCKIIKGELPATKIFESEHFIAFLALYRNAEGHTLLVPKQHSNNILEMNPAIGIEMVENIHTIGTAQQTGLGVQGFNIGVNTGKVAGQVVFHTHIHIIPRYENDGLKHWKSSEASEEEQTVVAGKIINALEQ